MSSRFLRLPKDTKVDHVPESLDPSSTRVSCAHYRCSFASIYDRLTARPWDNTGEIRSSDAELRITGASVSPWIDAGAQRESTRGNLQRLLLWIKKAFLWKVD
jgi:hypothetical protein